jgi:pimeloyl-ACP methyl ester carboxylesterase
VINHIEAEELDNVILVGHSFGGAVITGAADKIPQRIRHLVYLDSIVLENGQSVFGALPAEVVAERKKLVAEQGRGVFIPPPSPGVFGIRDGHPLENWVKRRLTPHPVSTYESPLRIDNPVGNARPCTYITCTKPLYLPLAGTRRWVRNQGSWNLR